MEIDNKMKITIIGIVLTLIGTIFLIFHVIGVAGIILFYVGILMFIGGIAAMASRATRIRLVMMLVVGILFVLIFKAGAQVESPYVPLWAVLIGGAGILFVIISILALISSLLKGAVKTLK